MQSVPTSGQAQYHLAISSHLRVCHHIVRAPIMFSLRIALPLFLFSAAASLAAQSLPDKARLLQKNLTERHMLDGLYISIVPAVEPGVKLLHTVDEPGN